MSDDIEDYWKDVVPPRTKAEEEKPITLGHLWIGLLGSGLAEPFGRRLIRVPDGHTLEFQVEFQHPQGVGVSGETIPVSGGALWLSKGGGKPVYAKLFEEAKSLNPGDTITFRIVIADSGNEYVSFRKLLQIYGVL